MANPNPEVLASPRASLLSWERRRWVSPSVAHANGSTGSDRFGLSTLYFGSSP